jgi:hypothetical protein
MAEAAAVVKTASAVKTAVAKAAVVKTAVAKGHIKTAP